MIPTPLEHRSIAQLAHNALLHPMQSDAIAEPSLASRGKRPASTSPSDSVHRGDEGDPAGIPLKRQRMDASEESAAPQPQAGPSSSRVIIPGLPSYIFRSPSAPLPGDNDDEPPDEGEDENNAEDQNARPPEEPHERARSPSVHAETYEILPDAERIAPASTLQDLLRRAPPAARRYNVASTGRADSAENDNYAHIEETDYNADGGTLTRRTLGASSSPGPAASTSRVVDLTSETSRNVLRGHSRSRATSSSSSLSEASDSSLPMPPGVPRARPPGTSSTSAIVVGDSPTPPLRPLASPQARREAAENGRIGAFGKQASPSGEGTESTNKGEEKEEKQVTLGELQCPICLGSPAPLVLTECGHAL